MTDGMGAVREPEERAASPEGRDQDGRSDGADRRRSHVEGAGDVSRGVRGIHDIGGSQTSTDSRDSSDSSDPATHGDPMRGEADPSPLVIPADSGRRMSELSLEAGSAGRERRSARGHWHARPRIGIMGGTFDPIHNGHLVAASEVAWVYDLDEVVFVPTGRPVFKLDKRVTNAEDRYLMTVIATASNPKFTVSRVDIDRPGVTYTIDTLRDMRALHPDADLFFITGADAVAEIMRWKDADGMWSLARFVAVTRPGYSSPDGVRLPAGRVDTLEIPALAISSTDVRRRASRGEPVWYLVPDGVVQYIAKHGLYR